MIKQTLFVGLACCVLAANTGCCELRSMICCPLGHIPVCDPSNYCDVPCGPCDIGGGTCGPDCGPACDSCGDVACAPCEPLCGNECSDPCEDPCGDPCGPNPQGTCGPLSWLFGIFTCGYPDCGCGELYWSDFHNQPPDCCDPCDRCGNWTGGGAGPHYQSSQYVSQPNEGWMPQDGFVAGQTGPNASRMISQTDRVVDPTVAQSGQVVAVQASHPRRASVQR